MIVCLGTTPTVQRTMEFQRLQLDAVNRAAAVRQFASGKSVNVARVVHTIGQNTLAVGFVGGDGGRFVRADLDSAGIGHDLIETEPSTRLCVTLIDQAQRTATELIEEPKSVAATDYRKLLERLPRVLKGAKVLVLSGTLPPGAPERFYAECIELAGPGIAVILDAKGAPLNFALEHRPMVVKINRSELSLTIEADVDDEDAVRSGMRQIIAHGAQWVIVTAGAEATYITDGRGFWRVQPPKVELISPIGSGDAFAAGLAAGIGQGQTVKDACALASACAAANAMTPDAGHLQPHDVQNLLSRIGIESL